MLNSSSQTWAMAVLPILNTIRHSASFRIHCLAYPSSPATLPASQQFAPAHASAISPRQQLEQLNPQHMQHHHQVSTHVQADAGLSGQQQQASMHLQADAGQSGQQHQVQRDSTSLDTLPASTSSFDLAMNLLGAPGAASAQLPQHMPQQPWALEPQARITPMTYKPHHFVARLSLKLFNCTPADLPEDLRAQLTSWLKCAPAGAEGYMRPGCVHLTLDALVDTPGNFACGFLQCNAFRTISVLVQDPA